MTDHDDLRAAVERAAKRLNRSALDAWDEFNESEGMDLTQTAAGAAAEAFEQAYSEVRKALAEHPTPEPTSGGEVTADELAEVLLSSWASQGMLTPSFDTDPDDARTDAAAILARFDVRKRP